jgi:hypothetical protein
MAKKLKKGQPLEELVKGSLEYTRRWIDDQFRRQFPYVDGGPNYYIVDTFADFVTVESYSSDLMPSEFFKVAYTKSGDAYSFAAKDQWEIVELAYQPAVRASDMAVAEAKKTESGKKKGKRFEERIYAQVVLQEREEGKPRRVKIEGAITANVVNGNKRRYPAEVVRSAVEELRSHLNESAGQGRAIQILGEAEHPSDKGGRPNLLETVTKWDEVLFDGERVDITGRIIETNKGKDILTLMEGGVMPGASLRGYGEGKTIGKGDDKVFEVSELHITGFDLVLEPSFQNSAQLIESQDQSSMEDDMNELLENLKKLLAEQPELFNKGMTEAQLEALTEKQLKKLDEALRTALGIDANANIIEAVKGNADKARQFDAMQAKNAVEEAKKDAVKDLAFGEKFNKMFSESIDEAEFNSADDVKKFAESLRKQYGKIASELKLKSMGFVEGKNIGVTGSVLELETGTPEFARGSFELAESIRKYENRSKGSIVERAESPAAMFTKLVLERFDTMYMKKLMAESQMLQEAELTTDLNLPYSVSRSIIEEAFPNLVAANIFDVGVIATSPTRLYYEATTGESGYAVTVTDEVETAGAEEVWYSLAHGRIDPGSVVVTSNPAGTTYVEGTDYLINYADGKIKLLSAGSVNANDVLVSYTCSEIRGGEMDPIERVKTSLSYKTIEAAADRLADQISSEAILFSRTQLGWDAVARTMANLVRQMRRKIDQGLLYMAFSAVKSVASNSTTAWTIGTTQDDLAELYALLGNAAVIVANRFYEPTFYLASITNADRLSNWEGFKRDGFPQSLLNAAGFAGMVKNRPVFASTEFPDSLWIVGNRELVQHRVLQPMTIKGPFPTFDIANNTTKIVAADQYYAEEYNATESLVPEKGAFVPVEAGS